MRLGIAALVAASLAPCVMAECSTDLFGALCDPSSAEMTTSAPETFQAEFVTTAGNFTVEVMRSWAPAESDRFYNLVRLGYYNNTRFYRMIPPFVVQWGPSGDPNLANVYNPKVCNVPNACFRNSPVIKSNTYGTLVFSAEGVSDTCGATNNAALICDEATSGTGGLVLASELFINLGNNSFLDESGFGAFGTVIGDGMKVVESLYAGYGEMQGGSMGDYLCTRETAVNYYPDAPCAGPNPDMLYSMDGGNAYFDANFPLLSQTLSAHIVAKDATTTAAVPATGDAAGDAAAGDAAHGNSTDTADAAGDEAHGGDAGDEEDHGTGASGMTPPENPEWPTSDYLLGVLLGTLVIGVLIVSGGFVVLLYLRKNAARRHHAASETEFGSQSDFAGESAIHMSGYGEK